MYAPASTEASSTPARSWELYTRSIGSLVQESYSPTEHLPPLLHPGAAECAAWEAVSGLKWGSAVFAGAGRVRPLVVPSFAGYVVGAEVEGLTSGPPVRVFSIHAPRRGTYDRAVNAILDCLGRQIILELDAQRNNRLMRRELRGQRAVGADDPGLHRGRPANRRDQRRRRALADEQALAFDRQ